VAGEQDGAALGADLVDAVLEHALHERVEPGGGLVQDEELDVGRERRDQPDLLAVALGVGAALLARAQLEALEQLGLALRVEPAAQAPEQVDDLAARERRPEGDRYALGNDLWSELFSFRTQWVQRVAASADEAIAALGDQAGAVAHLVELRDMCQFLEKEMADMEKRWRTREQG
jgi:hypothetical protein